MQHKFGAVLAEIALQIDRQSLKNRSPCCLRSICKSTTYLEAWEDDEHVFLPFVFAAASKKCPLWFLTPIRGSAFRNRFVFSISLVNHLILHLFSCSSSFVVDLLTNTQIVPFRLIRRFCLNLIQILNLLFFYFLDKYLVSNLQY